MNETERQLTLMDPSTLTQELIEKVGTRGLRKNKELIDLSSWECLDIIDKGRLGSV